MISIPFHVLPFPFLIWTDLFLKKQAQNKTKRIDCVCISGYHCTSPQCESCVRNKECQPGEKISKAGKYVPCGVM